MFLVDSFDLVFTSIQVMILEPTDWNVFWSGFCGSESWWLLTTAVADRPKTVVDKLMMDHKKNVWLSSAVGSAWFHFVISGGALKPPCAGVVPAWALIWSVWLEHWLFVSSGTSIYLLKLCTFFLCAAEGETHWWTLQTLTFCIVKCHWRCSGMAAMVWPVC